ncbi:MAG: DUF2157 domain-containing protein [bacterium]|nr:DUF2157 domain-containing protein [bacterium]
MDIDVTVLMPQVIISCLENWYLEISVISFVVSAVCTVVSYAFVKRRNWARIFFVVFLLLSAVVSGGGIFFQGQFQVPVPGDMSMVPVVEAVNKSLTISLYVMVIVIVVFHCWLAFKLLSKEIKEEFREEIRSTKS